MSFQVVTISNRKPEHDYYCYDSWLKSLRNQGVEPLILPGFQGLNTKPRELWRAINDGRINADIVICCDSWDLIFQNPISKMVEDFLEENVGVIISAEINCFPDDYKEGMDAVAHPYPDAHNYVNSGFIIGYTSEVKKMLDAMGAEHYIDDYHDGEGWHHFNDQTSYMKAFVEQPVPIGLDRYSKYSTSVYGMNNDEFVLSQYPDGTPMVRNRKHDSISHVIHWNGGAKSMNNMKEVLQHLNLL